MANKNEEIKKTSTKKTNTIKKSTKNKTNNNSQKSIQTKSNKKNTTKASPKKTTNKTVTKKNNTPKKTTIKKNEKELEKTIIIEDIENKINDIVENKVLEEKDIITTEKVAKLENAKYTIRKKNKHLLAIGVLISLLGVIALIIALIANRIVDKEFISDNAIVMMVIASILIEIFGAFIIINES